MSKWVHRAIQHTQTMGMPTLVREVNDRLRNASLRFNENYMSEAYAHPLSITADGTYVLMHTRYASELTGVILKTSSGTASATIQIDGVTATVEGGSPISATTTITRTDTTSAEAIPELGELTVVVTGISGNTLYVTPQVRRA